MTDQPVKLKDIAEKVGTSSAVVSSILGGGAGSVGYSEQTRQRVFKVARAYNYRPKSANGIAIIHCSGERDPDAVDWLRPISPMLASIHREAIQRGKLLAVLAYSEADLLEQLAAKRLPKVFQRRHVEGLIVTGFFRGQVPAGLARIGMPYVLMNMRPGASQQWDAVSFDERLTGWQATRHLIERGHRRILYLGTRPSAGHYSVSDRLEGYLQAMYEAGLEPWILDKIGRDDPQFRSQFADILTSRGRPEAIFAYDEWQAVFAYHMICQAGLGFEQIGLVSTALADKRALEVLGINHLALPGSQMGRAAFNRLLERNGAEGEASSMMLRPSLQDLGSVPERSVC